MEAIFKEEKQIGNEFITRLNGVSVYMKREDLLHPQVSGNKFRKLKYNIREALFKEHDMLLTFGGAFSNHITATAAAGKHYHLKTIGIIRGEELAEHQSDGFNDNPSLQFAQSCGMRLEFVSREDYRLKKQADFIENLRERYGNFYLVPEGGTNALAIAGCEEILKEEDFEFDVITCAVGTGGTISGLINSSAEKQKVLGFPALKGDFLKEEISALTGKKNWELATNYHFGGYAKVEPELIQFINKFSRETGIQLDPVYTGKMMYGLFDLIEKGHFSANTRILAIHTGGLQGISGMNRMLKKKNLPLILV